MYSSNYETRQSETSIKMHFRDVNRRIIFQSNKNDPSSQRLIFDDLIIEIIVRTKPAKAIISISILRIF